MVLYSRSYGSGHPLIILHGLFGSSDNWHMLGKKFGESFHTCIPDARNHGRSQHTDDHNYTVMAADIEDFMNQQHLASSFLIGHSMGGKTGMLFALTYPERVDKLVVVDIAPRRYSGDHDEIFHALTSFDPATMSDRKIIDETLARTIPEYAVRQLLMKNLFRDEEGKFQWKMNLSSIKNHYNEIAGEIQSTCQYLKPTLFIRGELSKYIREKDEPMMKNLFPAMKVMTIGGAGHWVHAEKPEEFTKTVLKFLRDE